MRLVIAIVLTMFSFSAAWATVYEWVDNEGVVHMTDDHDKVPLKYRKVMRARDIDTREVETPRPVPEGQTVGVPVPPPVQAESYGGHDEEWWRASFREARESIRNLKDQIVGKKKSMEELHRVRVLYQKSSDRVAYYALADEIAKDEEAVKGLEGNLARLNSEADGAGVPQEWRQ